MQTKIHRLAYYICIVLITSFAPLCLSQPASLSPIEPPISKEEALIRATSAYIYGYPLVTLDMSKRIMTNTVTASGNQAPMGQFINLRKFPEVTFREVTAPNADMLYSFAWVDVSREPYILHVPDEKGRYYIMPLISGWGDVIFSIGTRTTGTEAQDFLIVGPNWHDDKKIPKGMDVVHSPTNTVWIKGRTYTTGKHEDLKIVHAIQDQYRLTPLSQFGKEYIPSKGTFDPSIDMKTSVRTQVNTMPAAIFFNNLAMLMKDNPPTKEDQPMIANLAKLGIVPRKPFDIKKVDPMIANAMEASAAIAQKKINEHLQKAGVIKKGWTYMAVIGRYGTDYLQRALIASIQPGAAEPEDLIYPVTIVDSSDERLHGENHYRLHFLPGELPPVNGFWSLTLYDDKYYFYPNPLNRYNISQRDVLQKNMNGSIVIYIQHDSPGPDKESNWLPAPKGHFILMFRLYWPKESLLNGTWSPPGLKKIVTI